jgi:alkanesulfonate monooxygenase SsuD/methylene tetrahydromethanopterin reductase-like flavin-dependent oxidoreductase (luciferase family)
VHYGDGWLPASATVAQLAEGAAAIRRLAAALDRPAPAGLGVNIFATVAASDAAARDVFTPTMGSFFPGEQLTGRNLVGSPDTVVRRLQEYEAAGLNLVEMKPIYRSVPELLGMLQLIAREVMPAFQREAMPAS